MFKNWLRYGLPATIIALALLGISLATNLQSWQSGSTGTVAAIDSNGGYNISGTGSVNFNAAYSVSTSATVPAITSSGSVTFAEPFAGTVYKKAILGLASYGSSGAATFVFPTAFIQKPVTLNSTMSAGSIGALTVTTTSVAIATSGSAGTGVIILEGQ